MNIKDVYAKLCNEPFNLRPWEIAKLSVFQIKYLYFAERDKNGSILPTPEPEEPLPSRYEWFVRHWRLFGLRDDLIDKLWKEHGK